MGPGADHHLGGVVALTQPGVLGRGGLEFLEHRIPGLFELGAEHGIPVNAGSIDMLHQLAAASKGGASASRRVGVGSQILKALGVGKMRLLSSPKKYHALGGFGLEVVEYVGE